MTDLDLYPPHCPQIPSNNVYVGARIEDHVVNYAPVFIKDKTVSAKRRAGDAFLGASAVTKEKAITNKRKRGGNDVSVAVNGSVTFMCKKGAVFPGQWVGVPTLIAKTGTEVTSGKECVPIVTYSAATLAAKPVGVCLAVASDGLSATVLLRRDAFLYKNEI